MRPNEKKASKRRKEKLSRKQSPLKTRGVCIVKSGWRQVATMIEVQNLPRSKTLGSKALSAKQKTDLRARK
jgi:hypothetical protein